MSRFDLTAVLRRSGSAPSAAVADRDAGAPPELPEDALQWSWPPYAPVEQQHESFDTAEWVPASEVWHPQLRVGRWTVVYRRAQADPRVGAPGL